MAIKPQPPPAAESGPYTPTQIQPLVCEQFNGIDTSTTRPGVEDSKCYWIDGYMPIGPRFLRTLYGIGPAIWSGTQAAPAPPPAAPTPPAVTITINKLGSGFFQVPSDWNNNNNQVEVYAGGGGGAGSHPRASAAGGGAGGTYASINNLILTSGASVPLFVGAGGSPGVAGQATFFNGATLAASSVGATGGAAGITPSSSPSGGGIASVVGSVGSVVHPGGNGGAGSGGISDGGGGGGGGAGGPHGAGVAGGNASGVTGGLGGAGDAGQGGAGVTTNTPGNNGAPPNSAGSGGGGSGSRTNCSGIGGQLGGGGGGAGCGGAGVTTGAAGGPGGIRITYTPQTAPPVGPTPASRITSFNFGNIGSLPIMIVLQDDGSVWQVNTATKAFVQIMPPGAILSPAANTMAVNQWGSQFIILVAKQTNGYWLWDGSVLYSAGSLSPQVTVTNVGANYSANPTIAASGGHGSGATFSATVTNGNITKITLKTAGAGYLATDVVTLAITDATGTGATATASLMPLGIQGTGVETYVGRVWVVNGATVIFSSPGSASDFTTGNGGGNFTSADSFLRVGYTAPLQTNGFLYLIADSSINYISGVTTSGTPPITTFTNQNADAETGTIWPNTVDVFGRNILFANSFGAHVSYGAAVTKTSEALDGVFNTLPNFGGLIPSAAKAIIFARKIWMLLLPIVDPVKRQPVNKLLMWDGKRWWASEQEVALKFIQHQEINSVLTAWGTDGNTVFPLFTTPSTGFTKTMQTKMWDTPGGLMATKAINRLWGAVQYYAGGSPTITVSVDNETGSAPLAVNVGPPGMHWTTANGSAMNWTTASGATMNWTTLGISVFPPTATAQQGVLNGMTVQTNAADMALISVGMQPAHVQYRG